MDFLTLLRAQWDRATALVLTAAAMLVLLLGYIGVSGTAHVAAQLPYFLSAGFFGLFLLTIAATLWLSADLRDEWRELRELRVQLGHEAVETRLPASPTLESFPVVSVAASPRAAANGSAARIKAKTS